jgi:hypothetical protein
VNEVGQQFLGLQSNLVMIGAPSLGNLSRQVELIPGLFFFTDKTE